MWGVPRESAHFGPVVKSLLTTVTFSYADWLDQDESSTLYLRDISLSGAYE